jgi:tRNA G18 (ribose-2'-O)-methylase SpoU
VTRELVYGRRSVREVVRAGRREILELLVTERALKAEPWLRDVPGLRLQVVPERRLNEAAETMDHQGVVAFCEPYRYADAHENAARVTPAVCKASAGAVEHLSVGVVVNLARYLEEIKGPQLWVWAAERAAETPIWAADLALGAALVFGAEGRGLRPGVRRACDDAFAIPLAGEIESLNVSVAAGVAIFEAARQRGS